MYTAVAHKRTSLTTIKPIVISKGDKAFCIITIAVTGTNKHCLIMIFENTVTYSNICSRTLHVTKTIINLPFFTISCRSKIKSIFKRTVIYPNICTFINANQIMLCIPSITIFVMRERIHRIFKS